MAAFYQNSHSSQDVRGAECTVEQSTINNQQSKAVLQLAGNSQNTDHQGVLCRQENLSLMLLSNSNNYFKTIDFVAILVVPLYKKIITGMISLANLSNIILNSISY